MLDFLQSPGIALVLGGQDSDPLRRDPLPKHVQVDVCPKRDQASNGLGTEARGAEFFIASIPSRSDISEIVD
jgi:hypothetical protein